METADSFVAAIYLFGAEGTYVERNGVTEVMSREGKELVVEKADSSL